MYSVIFLYMYTLYNKYSNSWKKRILISNSMPRNPALQQWEGVKSWEKLSPLEIPDRNASFRQMDLDVN